MRPVRRQPRDHPRGGPGAHRGWLRACVGRARAPSSRAGPTCATRSTATSATPSISRVPARVRGKQVLGARTIAADAETLDALALPRGHRGRGAPSGAGPPTAGRPSTPSTCCHRTSSTRSVTRPPSRARCTASSRSTATPSITVRPCSSRPSRTGSSHDLLDVVPGHPLQEMTQVDVDSAGRPGDALAGVARAVHDRAARLSPRTGRLRANPRLTGPQIW